MGLSNNDLSSTNLCAHTHHAFPPAENCIRNDSVVSRNGICSESGSSAISIDDVIVADISELGFRLLRIFLEVSFERLGSGSTPTIP